MIDIISKLAIPALVLITVFYGFIKKTDVYENFIEGSKDSFKMIYNLFPTLLAMILGINLLLESNILAFIAGIIQKFVNIPTEIVPLALLRPISGSSALAILNNIYLIKILFCTFKYSSVIVPLRFSFIYFSSNSTSNIPSLAIIFELFNIEAPLPLSNNK